MTNDVKNATNYVTYNKSIVMIRNKSKLSGKFIKAPTSNHDVIKIIGHVKKGISYSAFDDLSKECPFTFEEWANFLKLSSRTMERARSDKRNFDSIHTERIFAVVLLYNKGLEVWGDKTKFNNWLEEKNIALGGIKPKDLLDSSFGISLLHDEIGRIEFGVFA